MKKLFLMLTFISVFTRIYAMNQPTNKWVNEIVNLASLNSEQVTQEAEEGNILSLKQFRKLEIENLDKIIDDITDSTPINKILIENAFIAFKEIEPSIAYKLQHIIFGLLKIYRQMPEHDALWAKNIVNTMDNEILFDPRFKKILQEKADLRLVTALDEKNSKKDNTITEKAIKSKPTYNGKEKNSQLKSKQTQFFNLKNILLSLTTICIGVAGVYMLYKVLKSPNIKALPIIK